VIVILDDTDSNKAIPHKGYDHIMRTAKLILLRRGHSLLTVTDRVNKSAPSGNAVIGISAQFNTGKIPSGLNEYFVKEYLE